MVYHNKGILVDSKDKVDINCPMLDLILLAQNPFVVDCFVGDYIVL